MTALLTFSILHPVWTAAFVLAVVVLYLLARRRFGFEGRQTGIRQEVRDHYHAALERWSKPREAAPPAGADAGVGAAPGPPAGTRLQSEVAQLDVRLGELATAFGSGLDRVEHRLAGIEAQLDAVLAGKGGGGVETDDDGRFDAGALPWGDGGTATAELVVSHPVDAFDAPAQRGWAEDPGGERVPVEIKDGEVVASQSYPPEAWLVPQGGGRAALSVNDEVPLSGFALDRFALYFDLGERREGRYVTQAPAEVRWDGERGTAGRPGRAMPR